MATHDERIHACLDGELPREALTPDEIQRLEALEGTLNDTALALRSAPVPDLTARIMGALPRVASAPPARSDGLLERVGRWLWSPLSISFRPAYALAGMAVALATVGLLPSLQPATPIAPTVASTDAESQLYVQFRIEVPGASEVALAGTFTGWQPDYALTEVSPGIWSAMVPLDPGVHDYTFVIDGSRMVVDPYAPSVSDSFGGSNSRLFLPVPGERA